MFSDVGPETSYRVVLHLLKGATTKFLDNYLMSDALLYYKWLSQNKISGERVKYLKKITSKIHRYLNSLGSNKKPPKISTLQRYLRLCRNNRTSLMTLDNVCLHFISSVWYVFSSYEQILLKMASGDKLNILYPSYPEVFLQISKNLIAAVIHHEAFINKTSTFVDQLANTKKTFDILLK